MSDQLTIDVQQFQDGSQVPPPPGFADFAGGGSSGVVSVVAGNDISVDSTDPANPIVSLDAPTQAGVLTVGDGSNGVASSTLNALLNFPGLSDANTGSYGITFGAGVPGAGSRGVADLLYFNITGAPGTALAPGTLIYKTTDGGTTWTAIL